MWLRVGKVSGPQERRWAHQLTVVSVAFLRISFGLTLPWAEEDWLAYRACFDIIFECFLAYKLKLILLNTELQSREKFDLPSEKSKMET